MPFIRQMRQRMPVRAKDIMVEIGPPRGAFRRGPLGNCDHREQHRRIGRVRPCREPIPPIIGEDVDVIHGLDLMPPELGQVESVPRKEVDHQRPCLRGSETGIGRRRIGFARRHGNGLTGQRMIHRPDIKITDRIRRIEGEAPSPRHHAGEIVITVIMTGNRRSIADPQARMDPCIHQSAGIFLRETGKIGICRQRPQIGGFRAALRIGCDPAQRVADAGRFPPEIIAARPRAIMITSTQLGAGSEIFRAQSGRETGDVRQCRRGALPACRHRRPVAEPLPDHCGPAQCGERAQVIRGRHVRCRKLHHWPGAAHGQAGTASRSLRRRAISAICRSEPVIA